MTTGTTSIPSCRRVSPAGRTSVLGAATRERRTLITLDKGARGSLATHARTDLPPTIVLRLRASGTKALREASIRAVAELSSGPSFATAVVTDGAIRARRPST